jgi:hypothetical protein
MFKRVKDFIKLKSLQVDKIEKIVLSQNNDLKSPKVNLGQIQAQLNKQRSDITSLSDAEFQVFSQWGDDGIIQFLVDKIAIPNKIFVEFGVENYTESNTRFLLINNKWSGLVIDGSELNIEYIKKDLVSWACDLHAKSSFITKENINGLIADFLKEGYDKEIGILSIDIDGNDYWVWEEINVVNPVIVITEYNSVFGPDKKWSIPYKKDFYRLDGDNTYQYWGASLNAFCYLASRKGYSFIGCNSNGNNAYFVRRDKMTGLKSLTAAEGFVESTFREYIDANGKRVGGKKRLQLIEGKEIVNVETGVIEII